MKILYILSLLLLLVSCWTKKDTSVIEELNNNSEWTIEKIDIKNNLLNWNFWEVIIELETKWWYEVLEKEEKDLLIYSYLQEWVYLYKEEEYSSKVIELLSEEEQNFQNLYFLGFANEIIKNYEKALKYYNKWLELENLLNTEQALLLNQIGHVYDLKWDLEKAYSFYYKAYELDNVNYNSAFNIARYLTRKWDYELAKQYFEYWLNNDNNVLKSEIYYSLSSIELELNWLKPNIDKSIEYAKLSIKYNPSYPMGYLWLARWYYMLNDEKYYKDIEENLSKSIKLNPNWYEAYYYYALYIFDLWKIQDSTNLLLKSLEVINNDMILMDNERNTISINIKNLILTLILINKIEISDNVEKIMDWIKKIPNWEIFINKQLSRWKYWVFSDIQWIDNYVIKLK